MWGRPRGFAATGRAVSTAARQTKVRPSASAPPAPAPATPAVVAQASPLVSSVAIPACAAPPPAPCALPASAVRVVDALYSEIPGAEVGIVHREARVPFTAAARAEDGSGDILSVTVPSAQTLLISDVEFYAQGPSASIPGDQVTLDDAQLAGYVAAYLLVDNRSPLDLYSEIDAPAKTNDQRPIKASAFSKLGPVLGGSGRQPHVYLRVNAGQTVRLSFACFRSPAVAVDHIGAILRGYLVPTAILAAKTCT